MYSALQEALNASQELETNSIYARQWRSFTSFVDKEFRGLHPLDASGYHVASYVAYCYITFRIAPSTIRSHVSVISLAHKCHDRPDLASHPLVKKALIGVGKLARKATSQSQIKQTTKLKPITLPQLDRFVQHLDLATFDGALLAAMFILAFRAGLRCGELVYAAKGKHTLSRDAVRIVTAGGRALVALTFTTYKHSGEQEPFILHVPATNDNVCPVAAVARYKKVRPNIPGPFFVNQVGSKVTRNFFAKALKISCEQTGYRNTDYNTHSFRSGFVTHLAAHNVPMATI